MPFIHHSSESSKLKIQRIFLSKEMHNYLPYTFVKIVLTLLIKKKNNTYVRRAEVTRFAKV